MEEVLSEPAGDLPLTKEVGCVGVVAVKVVVVILVGIRSESSRIR